MKQVILSIACVLTAFSFAIAKLENNSSRVHIKTAYPVPTVTGTVEGSQSSTVSEILTSPFIVICPLQINVLLK